MRIRVRQPSWRALLGLSSALLVLGAAPDTARGQTFPPASGWVPLPCGSAYMTDPVRDQLGFYDEKDIVGSAEAPAGFSAWDPNFLFLQLRVDGDPAQGGGKLRPFAWGFEFSTDKVANTYEYLIVLNGNTNAVEVYRNTSTTKPDSAADPADALFKSYPFASNARITAAGSGFNGNPDFLVSLAVPWSDLQAIGLGPSTPTVVWAGTSNIGTALDGDIACHNGGSGEARLDQIGGSTPVVFNVNLDTDGDKYPDWYEVRSGTNPTDPASHPTGSVPPPGGGPVVFAGGGGCRVITGIGGGLFGAAALLLAFVVVIAARARRRKAR